MSIDIELYGQIRTCRVEGKSKRATARLLGISRVTVSKYWDGEHIPGTEESRVFTESTIKAEIKNAMRKYYGTHKSSSS